MYERKTALKRKIIILIILLVLLIVMFGVVLYICRKPPETGNSGENLTVSNQSEKDSPENGNGNRTDRNSSADESSNQGNSTESEDTTDIMQEADSGIAAPSNSGALQVIGSQLCDEDGNAVQLRGISTHGLAWFPGYVNAALFEELRKDWDVNVIRLAMYTYENGGYCAGGDKSTLKDIVNRGVQYATDNDMYVIIDWHVLNDRNPNTYKDEAKAFWAEMSERYRDYNNVLYEICNEPNGDTSWENVKSYANEIIPVIREKDKDAVIIVGTPTWSQDVDKAAESPLAGYSNIMYALHFYAATHKDYLRQRMIDAVNAGLPIFVSEYGICDASGNGDLDLAEADKWVQAMNDCGISYVNWSMANKNESASILKANCTKYSDFSEEDLSPAGTWLYRMLTDEEKHFTAQKNGEASDKKTDKTPGKTDGQSETTTGEKTDGQSGTATGEKTDGQSGTTIEEKTEKTPETAPKEKFQAGNLAVDATVVNSWDSGDKRYYQYAVSMENKGEETYNDWKLTLQFGGSFELQDGWNGNYTVDKDTLLIQAKDYNNKLAAGSSTSDVGFIICGSANLKLKGIDF